MGNIDGQPTKDFFVKMITRDISIREAILDLVDNSIDGAKTISDNDYSGLHVKISLSDNSFILEDNCGGFSLDHAKNYAFRFGRPNEAKLTGGSIGRFGIGMKRALFKMGEVFEVESKTNNDHFQVNVNQTDWLSKKESVTRNNTEIEVEDWSFDYVNITPVSKNLNNNGTFIKVTNLFSKISSDFNSNEFLNDLENDLENILNFSIEKGLDISLNGEKIRSKNIDVYNSNCKPYKMSFKNDEVEYRVICGLSDSGKPSKAGWYVYCNDRLVVEADTSHITCWGVGGIPSFNNDFAMFRGIIFLNSDSTIKLPLTTTKKGLDTSSVVYKKLLGYITKAMNPVLSFLKDIRKLESPREYREMLKDQNDNRLSIIDLRSIKISSQTDRSFEPPSLNYEEIQKKPEYVRIAFSKERKNAEKTRQYSGRKNFKEFGEHLYDYYISMEELENE